MGQSNPRGHSSHGADTHADTQAVKDPVCGMTVDPAKTPHHAGHGGTVFHFCSAGCRTKFVADPARYLADVFIADKLKGGVALNFHRNNFGLHIFGADRQHVACHGTFRADRTTAYRFNNLVIEQ